MGFVCMDDAKVQRQESQVDHSSSRRRAPDTQEGRLLIGVPTPINHNRMATLAFLSGAALVGAYLYYSYRTQKEPSLLSEEDDNGAKFALDQATQYCSEDEYTRLARDVIVFSANNKFLVKKWGGAGHRAKASHGNALGTFLYRPPKNIPANEGDIKFAVPMWEIVTEGWLLTFAINGLGPKNADLGKMFGNTAKEEMLSKALTSKAKCYVMPSESQSDKASIAAPMTVLVNFIEREEISLEKFPDFVWASLEQALDPTFNVHAGVVANYCLETGMATSEMLDKYGWTEGERLVTIQLPAELSTLRAWGTDVSWIYTTMKGLLLEAEGLPKPQPHRTCEPRKPV